MPNDNRFIGITTERSIRYNTPACLESVEDLCYDPFHIIDDIRDEISPPQDREEFMNWYFARRFEGSSVISSRDVQAAMRDAEDVWRFVSGGPDFIELEELPMRPERTERDRLRGRTYINAKDRRKGNAVVAVVIACS